MSDTPKFEVIDRRKYKAETEEQENVQHSAPEAVSAPEPAKDEPRPGPQLVTEKPAPAEVVELSDAEADLELEGENGPELPPAPTAEESERQKAAYESAAQRLEDLVRAQNPGVGAQPPVTFEHLVQQFYVSAMIQMGAGTGEGQRPRVDILGAKQTIDLMSILAEKTKGKLSEAEERTLQSVLYEVRLAFLELTNMITLQGVQPPVPPPGRR